jgi:hypothetical protein
MYCRKRRSGSARGAGGSLPFYLWSWRLLAASERDLPQAVLPNNGTVSNREHSKPAPSRDPDDFKSAKSRKGTPRSAIAPSKESQSGACSAVDCLTDTAPLRLPQRLACRTKCSSRIGGLLHTATEPATHPSGNNEGRSRATANFSHPRNAGGRAVATHSGYWPRHGSSRSRASSRRQAAKASRRRSAVPGPSSS